MLGVTSVIKDRRRQGLFTSTTPSLLGGTSITEAHISSITDSIIIFCATLKSSAKCGAG
ncbi:MAG: hypothetical protein U0694_00240 [Anaerolineae bacterium]